jgi:type I restriction enzyme M protein
MRKLKRAPRAGRAAVIVPNGILSSDGVGARVKEGLLRNFRLHTIVRLPNGVFTPYTPIPSNIMFFDASGPTSDIWYYEHALPDGKKNYTKTTPLQFDEFKPCLEWWNTRQPTSQAWKVSAADVLATGCNLDISNPNAPSELSHRPPEELLDQALAAENEVVRLLGELRVMLEAQHG